MSLPFLLLSQNPIFVPPLETVEETTAMQVSCDAPITLMVEPGCILVTSFVSTMPHFFLVCLHHSVDSGKHVEYDIQEIAVEMNREEEDEEDWLKMDHPPEWLRRVEVEEYDDWMPPPVRPPPPEVMGHSGGIPLVLFCCCYHEHTKLLPIELMASNFCSI